MYFFPAAQWAATINASSPLNRNSEMLRRTTVTAAKAIAMDGADPWFRRYFEFSNPGIQDTGLTVLTDPADHWTIKLSETGIETDWANAKYYGSYGKSSAKAKVGSADGYAVGTNQICDDDAKFTPLGVVAGDSLVFNSRRYGYYGRHPVLTPITRTCFNIGEGFTWGGAGFPAGATAIRYKVIRSAPKGECYIDQWYGTGPEGYGCSSNTFYQAFGPITQTGGNIIAHFPSVQPGFTTLSGTPGFIPAILDGMTRTTANPQMEWNVSVSLINTRAATLGGLGAGGFDWNNQDLELNETKVELNVQEIGSLYWQ
jgi:hypothetical protein